MMQKHYPQEWNGKWPILTLLRNLVYVLGLIYAICVIGMLWSQLHHHSNSNNERVQLLAQTLGNLYDNMKFSDITINVRGREFKAHKSILAARSMFFDAMFDQQPLKEKTNQIEEDVEPEVFQEILCYIYTGRVSEMAMKNMAVEMFAVAEKYSLDDLKNKCHHELFLYAMSSSKNCLQLLLLSDEYHPAFRLRKFVVYDLYFSIRSNNFVSKITKEDWKKAEKDHPEKILSILQELAQGFPSFLFNYHKEILREIYQYIALNIS